MMVLPPGSLTALGLIWSKAAKETGIPSAGQAGGAGGVDPLSVNIVIGAAPQVLPGHDGASAYVGDDLGIDLMSPGGAHRDAVNRPDRRTRGVDPLCVDVV